MSPQEKVVSSSTHDPIGWDAVDPYWGDPDLSRPPRPRREEAIEAQIRALPAHLSHDWSPGSRLSRLMNSADWRYDPARDEREREEWARVEAVRQQEDADVVSYGREMGWWE
jgi:hypothetical protein